MKPASILPLFALLAAGCAAGPPAAPARIRPNVVLILADDLGYGDLGCYGGSIPTPHIDALAASGLRLTDFHSNGAVCSPTRAALMTGQYQQRSGIVGVVTAKSHRHTGLDPGRTTIAEELGARGYRTALFGKWHLGYAPELGPTVQGFDEFRGFVSGNVDYVSHVDQQGHVDWWRDGELDPDEGYATDLVTEYGVDFIRRHAGGPQHRQVRGHEQGSRFFLYLAHGAPHYPYQGRGAPALRRPGEAPRQEMSPAERRAAYAEMIVALDEGVGRILRELAACGLTEETLVVFCSDNGPARVGSAGPWRGRKGTLWEGGHRVPALVSWPGVFPPGDSEQAMMGMDLAPTFLSFAGAPSADGRFDGADLARAWGEGAALADRDLVWEHGRRAALRRGDWKLVVERLGAPDASPELYDLRADPGEQLDLAGRHPERARELLEALRRRLAELSAGVTRRS